MTPEHHTADLAERDPLALAMLAAWVNVSVDKLPATMCAMADPHAMAAWKRVGDAAVAYADAVARERVEALEAALLPFAREADTWECDDALDECPVLTGGPADERVSVSEFTIGDLRRARAVLASGSSER